MNTVMFLVTFGAIVVFAGIPDYKSEKPETTASIRQAIITVLAVVLIALAENL